MEAFQKIQKPAFKKKSLNKYDNKINSKKAPSPIISINESTRCSNDEEEVKSHTSDSGN